MTKPDFTVIMATWNRGRHILPSVQSVLRQSHANFELWVIGDCLTDDTENHLQKIDDARLNWKNNSERWGTQSGPNNEGLKLAKAPIAAYIGHDDIWAPNHLEEISKRYKSDPQIDAVYSGLLSHIKSAKTPYRVSGMFNSIENYSRRFYAPPSCLTHKINKLDPTYWPRRTEIEIPVDQEFARRLGEVGYKIASTETITVHKFPARFDHLAYLKQNSKQQIEMLEKLQDGSLYEELPEMIKTAKETGFYMWHTDDYRNATTNLEMNDRIRGVKLPDLIPIGSKEILIEQCHEKIATDWYGSYKRDQGWKWAGPNPNPSLALPYVSEKEVELTLDLASVKQIGFPDIEIKLNDTSKEFEILTESNIGRFLLRRVRLFGRLKRDAPSVLSFSIPPERCLERYSAFALGSITLREMS